MRKVLVTGSSRGIGKAVALSLLKESYHVIFHGRTESESLKNTLKEAQNISSNFDWLCFDVSDYELSKEVLESYIDKNGAFYGVVLNAGISKDAPFPALNQEDWQVVLDTSLGGFYNVLQPLVMPMIRLKQGGRIVTLSSISGQVGNRGQVNYSAAKGGVIAATKSLALELGKRNITVNCVAPGLIETEMLTQEVIDYFLKMIPLQRLGTPKEVANLIKFLLSDEAAYITRQVISINGGLM